MKSKGFFRSSIDRYLNDESAFLQALIEHDRAFRDRLFTGLMTAIMFVVAGFKRDTDWLVIGGVWLASFALAWRRCRRSNEDVEMCSKRSVESFAEVSKPLIDLDAAVEMFRKQDQQTSTTTVHN